MAAAGSTPLRPSPGWSLAFALVGAVAVIALIAVAALIAVPPSMANLASSTADGVTAAPVGASAEAAIVVPAGWIVVRQGEQEILVRTPDGALEARVSAASAPAEEALAAAATAAADDTGAEPGAERSEPLASGSIAVHVDVGSSVVVAAVAKSPEAPASVVVDARVRDGADPTRYRAALAQLLDGVRP